MLRPSYAGRRRIVNSQIVGANVNDAGRSLALPPGEKVEFLLQHLQREDVSNPVCVFWNLQTRFLPPLTSHYLTRSRLSREWDPSGCTLAESNRDFSRCACSHLTSFAVLMDVAGNIEGAESVLGAGHAEVLEYLTRAGCALSVLALILAAGVFTFFPSLWNDRNTIHRNLCVCLLAAELLFLFGIDQTGPDAYDNEVTTASPPSDDPSGKCVVGAGGYAVPWDRGRADVRAAGGVLLEAAGGLPALPHARPRLRGRKEPPPLLLPLCLRYASAFFEPLYKVSASRVPGICGTLARSS